MQTMDDSNVVLRTQRWLERAVIGLNLCPFAKAVHAKGQIHYAVSSAKTTEHLLQDLTQELKNLVSSDAEVRATTLLLVPHMLEVFLDFNDFLDQADQVVHALALDGVIQIASFHPNYQFAGTQADDISNYTNRSPFPVLHLLREASIDEAVASFPDASSIFETNTKQLEKMGHAGWVALGLSD